MHILIPEIDLSGHHAIYLENIAIAHLSDGHILTIGISEEFIDNEVLKLLQGNYPNKIFIFQIEAKRARKILNPAIGSFKREIGVWCLFREIYNKVTSEQKIDYVFYPYLDYCLYAVALLGSPFKSTEWSAICMRPSFHYYKFHLKKSKQTVVDWMKQNFFLRLLKNKTLKSIFSIDELLVNSIDTNSENIKYLEDPVNTPIFMDCNGLKEKYGLRSLSKVILVYGVIDHRKNINALLSILDVIHGWSVLIVGKQDRFTEVNLLSSQWNNLRNQGRIAVINRYISTKEEEEIFNLSDVVWVGYLQHYQMSGVLVKAGVYKRPIIACEEGLIGWHAKEYELGVRTNFSKESLKKAFDVLSDENIRQVMGEFGYSKFKNYNWSNFKNRIKS
jgi:hypothetical protein